jgi:ribose 5-phosphate isomerase A
VPANAGTFVSAAAGETEFDNGFMPVTDVIEKKRRVARAALQFIEPGCVLGIGTGSTVNELIAILDTVRDRIETIVSSSRASTELLRKRGYEVSTLNETIDLDVYIDGADEANKRLQLIKGGGGALTREKVLAAAARRFVCIIDDSKLVGMLGSFPLPVEVLPMAQEFVAHRIVRMRGRPVWRDGFVTDNGNHILDVHDLAIGNPTEMETRLNQIPGIVSVGIFAVRPADILLIADDAGVREMRI